MTPDKPIHGGDRELAAEMMLDRPDESRVMPLIAAHVAARLAPVEAERDALRATVAKMREALADAAVDSAQFTRDVAALQHFKGKSLNAWSYWHGGISYARKTAQAELTALRSQGDKL